MKRGSEPIQAERVFRVVGTNHEYRLYSTATDHAYEGPVFANEVPPYTADEWSRLEAFVHESWSFSAMPFVTHKILRTVSVEDADGALEIVKVLGGDLRRVGRFMRHPSIHEGVHAFRIGQIPDDYREQAQAIASVELFGRVVEYERGYRAEKMRLRGICLIGMPGDTVDPDDVLRTLSTRYDCEVTWPTLAAKWRSTKSSWTRPMRRAASNLICFLADRLDNLDSMIDPDESE